MDEFNTSTPISNRRRSMLNPQLSAIRGNIPPPDFSSTALGSPITRQKSPEYNKENVESPAGRAEKSADNDILMKSYRSEQDMSVDVSKRSHASVMDFSAPRASARNDMLTDDDSLQSDNDHKEDLSDDSDEFRHLKRKNKLCVLSSDDSESDEEILPPSNNELMQEAHENRSEELTSQSHTSTLESSSTSRSSTTEISSESQSTSSSRTQSDQLPSIAGPSAQKVPEVDRAFNFDMYDRLLATDKEKRLFGGKMTDNRIDQVVLLTNDALASLHTALSTAPDETKIEETPKGLKIELMPHQKQGLAWMLWRECQFPPCGILGDDMGLGKTLSVISLILKRKNDYNNCLFHPEDEQCRKQVAVRNKLIPSRATLIVAPASLIMQWQKEVKDRVQSGRLSVAIYHGNNRENDAKRLAKYDIVITTYGTLTSEMSIVNSTISIFNRISWERVVLDEAHTIKNRKTQGSRLVCQLSSVYRWCLTGTPIHNELWDLFSLIRFLRITPFSDEGHWKQYIMGGSSKDSNRLNTLVKGVLLRRTKNQINTVTNKPIIELHDRAFTIVKLDMKGIEDSCYQQMFEASRQRAMQLVEDNGSVRQRTNRHNRAGPVANPFLMGSGQGVQQDRFQAMSCLLALLLRLRQACVHLCLTRHALDLDAFKSEGIGLKDNEEVAELERTFSSIFVSEPIDAAGKDEEQVRKIEEVFSPNFCSTKIRAVLSHLDQVMEKKEKCVIVSQWTGVLSIIETYLVQRGIPYTSITGQILPKHRQDRIDSFNRPRGGAEVMLLSLTAGGVGLNLVGGNHLFIVDLHWNPAMENQACDRIYRMGQTKDVFIHKFICERTIENRVLELQEKKTVLADTVLAGVASKKLTKLTMNDLKFLFELDSRGRAAPRAAPQPVAAQIPGNFR